MALTFTDPDTERFLSGKSEITLNLYTHFISVFSELGDIELHATKSMIAVSDGNKRIAWITQFGKNFIHVVFPFHEAYHDNLCFQKVGQVPGSNQFNHHLRILYPEDVNAEVVRYLNLALGKA